MVAVTIKFSKVISIGVLVNRQVEHTEPQWIVPSWHLHVNSHRHFKFYMLTFSISWNCLSLVSLILVNDMLSTQVFSPEIWSPQERLHFFRLPIPLPPNLSLSVLVLLPFILDQFNLCHLISTSCPTPSSHPSFWKASITSKLHSLL